MLLYQIFLSICYACMKKYKKSYQKYEISAPTSNDKFELSDGSDIQSQSHANLTIKFESSL